MPTLTFRFPFGRHKGTPLAEVDTGYLEWCLSSMENLYADTRQAIQAEVSRRNVDGLGAQTEKIAKALDASVGAKVTTISKEMDAVAVCDTCGRVGSKDNPLVQRHRGCDDSVPF